MYCAIILFEFKPVNTRNMCAGQKKTTNLKVVTEPVSGSVTGIVYYR
jgi:hypothetical protein